MQFEDFSYFEKAPNVSAMFQPENRFHFGIGSSKRQKIEPSVQESSIYVGISVFVPKYFSLIQFI
ncbi:hypothetical protein ABM34_05785 [Companilactobacillus ginsenosidimutans]|uniref:Uncharacterized protein n=1 Tax=Companilactobacillus ginsenosidimutans TaxID=1007676 RepID=A0A0H4QGP2_9LACO|nr:hypothetical protein ABM34_05785 [Companilactobacillus ginsenosidimutans]